MTSRSIVPFDWGGPTLPGRVANDDPFVRLWNNVDRLFDSFFGEGGLTGWQPSAGAIGLPVEVYETEGEIKVVAELPGVEEKDVSVELTGNILTIKGEKKAENERKEESYHVAERRYGAFSRMLQLAYEVEADKVQATFKNGVLSVTMPKPAELQRQVRRIEVKAA